MKKPVKTVTKTVVKKAQDGSQLSPYMQKRAAQDKVKAENVRKKDSIMQRNANAAGKDLASYKESARANAKAPRAPQEGLYTSKDTKSAEGKEGTPILTKLTRVVTGAPGCIFTNEDKSGVKKRNGGKIKSKKK